MCLQNRGKIIPPLFNETLQNKGKQIKIRCGHLNLLRSITTSNHIFRILSRDENIQSVSISFENTTIIPKKNIPVEFNSTKKYHCLSRFFKSKKDKGEYSYPTESKSAASKPRLSCAIL